VSLFKRLWGNLPGSSDSEAPSPAATESQTGAEAAGWPTQDRRQRTRRNAKSGLSALIIDDSPTIVAALGKILRSGGFKTLEAGDAESGLELAKQAVPNLIFLDIVLPGMNGFAALRLIRKEPGLRAVPVIMISGHEHATEQFYANRIGADDFMKKPFSRFEIFSRIESMLDQERVPRRKTEPARASQAAPIVAGPSPAASFDMTELSAAAGMLAARKELTAMGLQYFDQTQYEAAVDRGDQLAIALFVRGGGIRPDAARLAVRDLAALPGAGRYPN
jgi:DNA-binding response OmpR family regulator